MPTYTAVNVWTLVSVFALCGAALFLARGDGQVLQPVGILLLIAFVLLITVRTVVTVERHGVRARLGLFGFPRRFVAMDQIKRAVVVNVRPIRDYKGWGERKGRFTRGYVCRKGEAIRLELDKERDFVITVNGARRAADRVNAFIEERDRPPRRSERRRLR